MNTFPVDNKKDLRFAWLIVHLVSEGKLHSIDEEVVIDAKRSIREYTKRKDDNRTLTSIDTGYGTFVCLDEFPTEITDRETAKEYFRCNWYREFVPSPYDCTGQVFTDWYKIWQRESDRRWMCWHGFSMDV